MQPYQPLDADSCWWPTGDGAPSTPVTVHMVIDHSGCRILDKYASIAADQWNHIRCHRGPGSPSFARLMHRVLVYTLTILGMTAAAVAWSVIQ